MKYSLILLLFFAQYGFAQEPTVSSTKDHKIKGTTIGFIAGFNRTLIDGKESDGDETGYIGGELYGGFFVETMLSKRLNIQNELLFSWTDSYHFIEVPVHLEYLFNHKWSVFAGPKFDYLVDLKDLGLSADVGAQYQLWRVLFFEFRYSYGISPQITDKSFFDINNGRRYTWRLGVGVNFGRGNKKVKKNPAGSAKP